MRCGQLAQQSGRLIAVGEGQCLEEVVFVGDVVCDGCVDQLLTSRRQLNQQAAPVAGVWVAHIRLADSRRSRRLVVLLEVSIIRPGPVRRAGSGAARRRAAVWPRRQRVPLRARSARRPDLAAVSARVTGARGGRRRHRAGVEIEPRALPLIEDVVGPVVLGRNVSLVHRE